MFSYAPYGSSTFNSSSYARVYEPVNNYLQFTQEIFVEGAQIVHVDLIPFTQTLQIPSLARVLRIHNGTVEGTQTLYKPVITRLHRIGSLAYTQVLISPVIIRKHYEIPDSVLPFTQSLHQVTIPKISIVDAVVAFSQTLQIPTTRYIEQSDALSYSQDLFSTKQTQISNTSLLGFDFTLLKPDIRYLNTVNDLLEFQQVLITPKGVIVNSLDHLQYEMTLNKLIINSYELFFDMLSSTYWSAYTVRREGKKILVVQEEEYSANLLETYDE